MVSLHGPVQSSAAYPSHPSSPGPAVCGTDARNLVFHLWPCLTEAGFRGSRSRRRGVPTALRIRTRRVSESKGWRRRERLLCVLASGSLVVGVEWSETSQLQSQLGIGGLQVMAAQEVKRVPAAPGRVAVNETILTCKLECCQLPESSCLTVGKLRPWKEAYLVTSWCRHSKGSLAFNSPPLASRFFFYT